MKQEGSAEFELWVNRHGYWSCVITSVFLVNQAWKLNSLFHKCNVHLERLLVLHNLHKFRLFIQQHVANLKRAPTLPISPHTRTPCPHTQTHTHARTHALRTQVNELQS